MTTKLKSFLKKILPENIILIYHFLISCIANFYFNFPSKKLIVIGVTGTKGKTTTCFYIWHCLNFGGLKTGMISTAFIDSGGRKFLNPYHMTMPGHFILKGLLAEMVKNNCKCCVIETTSEGIKQWRHWGIDYDICVFTNLSPEHLPSHKGSFEIYKKTKGKLFERLSKTSYKIFQKEKIPKVIIVNRDDKESDYFLSFKSDLKITFGKNNQADYNFEIKESNLNGVNFSVKSVPFEISLLGSFNVYNALPAIIIGTIFKIPLSTIQQAIKTLNYIPGRMEKIEEGQPFTVLVDYAHEKKSMTTLLDFVHQIKQKSSRVIILLGAEGGGRDKSKRSAMGKIVGKKADYVVVSNVDPYQDDPREILEEIAKSAEKEGKERDKNLFVIEDRREGIKKALSLARPGDWVLITGKGAEQSMIIGSKIIPWDDRKVVREELRKILSK